jgi:hypothetical protein
MARSVQLDQFTLPCKGDLMRFIESREQDGSWATTNRTVSGRAEATDARQRPGLGAGLWT